MREAQKDTKQAGRATNKETENVRQSDRHSKTYRDGLGGIKVH